MTRMQRENSELAVLMAQDLKIPKGKFKPKKFDIFKELDSNKTIAQLIEADDLLYSKHEYTSNSVHICYGKLKKEIIIKKLFEVLEIEDNRPELDKSTVSLFTLKIDKSGFYIKESLRISPMLWGLYRCCIGRWIKTERIRLIESMKLEKRELVRVYESNKKIAKSIIKDKKLLEENQNNIKKEISKFEEIISKTKEKRVLILSEEESCKSLIEEWCRKIDLTNIEYGKRLEKIKKGRVVIDDSFWEEYFSSNEDISTNAQIANPWSTDKYNREREKLFYLALKLHKEFILSSKSCRDNLINLLMMWKNRKNSIGEYCNFSARDRERSFEHLINTLFLFTPVISTTFASVGRFLKDIKKPEKIGLLIIDTVKMISESFKKYDGYPDLYVISPFTTVIVELKKMVLANKKLIELYGESVEKWCENCCGTVHKFQGKESNEVIFLLGCDNKATGAVNWVKSNILNVAVTRAKYRIYIVGDSKLWTKSEIFRVAYDLIQQKVTY